MPQINTSYYKLCDKQITPEGILFPIALVTVKDVKLIERQSFYPRSSLPAKDRRREWEEYKCHITGAFSK